MNHDAALARFLAVRERSTMETRSYLKDRRGLASEQADKIVQSLVENNILDDARFARNRSLYRLAQGRGVFFLKRDLSASGIDPQLCRETIDHITEDDYIHAGLEFLQKRRGGPFDNARITRYLSSRGFTMKQALTIAGMFAANKEAVGQPREESNED